MLELTAIENVLTKSQRQIKMSNQSCLSNDPNQSFYKSLKQYELMCFQDGSKAPLFLKNKSWWQPFKWFLLYDCIMILLLLLIITLVQKTYQDNTQNHKDWIIYLNITILILKNVAYFLTQFMNPGIRNQKAIEKVEFDLKGQIFCTKCECNRTREMTHCNQCVICVLSLDHHCKFLKKCIAGDQKYAYYSLLLLVMIGLMSKITAFIILIF